MFFLIKLSMFVCSQTFLFNSIFYCMTQQCSRREGFYPGALMSCFLSFPKWYPILRGSPVSVLVVCMYIRVWQIHSALFGNFSGTELNRSESDKSMEPEWQLDASPVLPDPFMHIGLRTPVSELSCFTEGMTWQNVNPRCLQARNDLRVWCYQLGDF